VAPRLGILTTTNGNDDHERQTFAVTPLAAGRRRSRRGTGHFLTVADGTVIHYKDWGSGRPVVFSHGWPLQGDAWEDQMFILASHGYRVIAHDRRGHGLSSQPWGGNDMDH
jgi:non-heme chloroperoxidase